MVEILGRNKIMQTYAVGQPFPGPSSQVESARVMTNDYFFDLAVYIRPEGDDVEQFRKGRLKIGAVVLESIPFVVATFSNLSFDAAYNILKVQPDDREKWLLAEGNAMNMYLVDCRDNTILGIRMLGLKPEIVGIIKNGSRETIEKYKTHQDADRAIIRVEQTYTTPQMMEYATGQIFRWSE